MDTRSSTRNKIAQNNSANRRSPIHIDSFIDGKTQETISKDPKLKKKLERAKLLLQQIHIATEPEDNVNEDTTEDTALADLESNIAVIQVEVNRIIRRPISTRKRNRKSQCMILKGLEQQMKQQVQDLENRLNSAQTEIMDLENINNNLDKELILLEGNVGMSSRVRPAKCIDGADSSRSVRHKEHTLPKGNVGMSSRVRPTKLIDGAESSRSVRDKELILLEGNVGMSSRVRPAKRIDGVESSHSVRRG